jgi:hypothetical protein
LDPDGTRLPAVAGIFYPSDKEELFESVHRCFTHQIGPGHFPQRRVPDETETANIECLVVPHAGYEYSGPVAANSYNVAYSFFQSSSEKKTTVIILGPNHYGIGSGVALSPAERWMTPLGSVNINTDFSTRLSKICNILYIDEMAHSREHSIEVQLPFLQVVSGKERNWTLVPISMMLQDHETSKEVAEAILKLISDSKDRFLLIGSSDLTHYEPHEQATRKDSRLLETVSKLDHGAFYSVLEKFSISSCGYGAIATVMQIAKKLGKQKGIVLKYATSGDITGDRSSVVGYPSVRFV